METERDQGHVPCVAPVDSVPPREPLVDEVPSGEQAAVQRDVGDPREAADVSQKRFAHCRSGASWITAAFMRRDKSPSEWR